MTPTKAQNLVEGLPRRVKAVVAADSCPRLGKKMVKMHIWVQYYCYPHFFFGACSVIFRCVKSRCNKAPQAF